VIFKPIQYKDSKNRIVISPLFSNGEEIYTYNNLNDYYFSLWMKDHDIKELNDIDFENGYFISDIYSGYKNKNISLELLKNVFKSRCDGKCMCISAYNFGIPKNIIYINNKEEDKNSLFMIDTFIDYHSREKRKVVIKSYIPQSNEQISKEIEIPNSIIIEYKNIDGLKERSQFKTDFVACIYQFLDIKEHYINHK
jgi:peptide deformylase